MHGREDEFVYFFLCFTFLVHLSGVPLAPAVVGGIGPEDDIQMQAWQEHVRLRDTSPFRGLHWQPLGPSMQGARIEALARQYVEIVRKTRAEMA